MRQTFDLALMTSIPVQVLDTRGGCVYMCVFLCVCVHASVCLQLAADSDMTNEGSGQK